MSPTRTRTATRTATASRTATRTRTGTSTATPTRTRTFTRTPTSPPLCGNGSINGSEECDGSNLNGATCQSLGFVSGALACAGDCTFDTAACVPPLGLDASFARDGVVTLNDAAGGNGADSGNAMTLDSQGRIVVTGHSLGTNGQLNMALWRFNADGTPDMSFNGLGYVTHAGAGGETIGIGVVIDADDRIVVGGYSLDAFGNWGMAIWRFDDDGMPDATFNGGGYVRDTTLQNAGDCIALDADGNIVVAGFGWNGFNWDTMVWRYLETGAPDTSFNGSGWAVHDNAAGGSGEDIAIGVGIDADGHILLAGYSTNALGNQDMTLWRYLDTGVLDTGFNMTGFVTHNGAAGGVGDDVGRTVAFDADGRILVTGWSPNANGDDDLAIWRFNANATLDMTFNGTGFVTHDGAAGGTFGAEEGRDLTIDASGRILVAGQSTNAAGNPDMAVWRYTEDGDLDMTATSPGFTTIGGTNGSDGGRGIRLDSMGRIIVAGRSANAAGDLDVAVWRLVP